MARSDRSEESKLLVSAASRTLRGQMRALTWVTLEDVALDAVAEDGQLVARTSARQVAERLKVNPAAAAGALRVLRDRGFVRLEPDQRSGLARRFGLWVYVLGPIPGIAVVPAGAESSSPLSLRLPDQEDLNPGWVSS